MFRAKQVWLENKTSRQAFYQVFGIQPDGANARPVVLTHYGKLSIAGGRQLIRPVTGGIVKIAHVSFREAVRAKTDKDYIQVNEQTTALLDENLLNDWLTQTFGASQTHTILKSMGLIAGGLALGDDGAPPPSVTPDYSSVPSEDDAELEEILHPRRGSW
jgi:hypothetical protein